MSKKVYCENCNEFVEFNMKENQSLYDDVLKVNYFGTICFCRKCSNEVNSNTIDSINIKKARDEYEKII